MGDANHRNSVVQSDQPMETKQSVSSSVISNGTAQLASAAQAGGKMLYNAVTSKSNKKDKKSKQICKKDIGAPMDFRHVQHVGWDPQKGFDANVNDPTYRQFFELAGVSGKHLKDKKTRDFIYK